MLRLVAVAALMLVAGCVSTRAEVQTAVCTWDGVWSTAWATPNAGDGPGEAQLSLLVTPGGLISGTWGDPAAGAVWGEAVSPGDATIVGEWSAAMDRQSQGAFLLHLTTASPDEHGLCRFEGVYTFGVGHAPLGWFGERGAN